MASRADFCPFLFLPITKPLVTWKRGGLKIFWDSQTHGFGGPQKPFIFILWLTSTGRARLAQTDSRKCPPPPCMPSCPLPSGRRRCRPFCNAGQRSEGRGSELEAPTAPLPAPHWIALLCVWSGWMYSNPATHALRRAASSASLLVIICYL
jgi:hypothetical protein